MGALEEIKRNLQEQKLAHAYIIEAPAGSERDKLVKQIAQLIVNGAGAQSEDNYARDVVEMQRSKSQYAVEDVIPFVQRLSMNPYGEHNVGLILEGELFRDIVQNKLLKTLEEPSDGTIIIIAIDNRHGLFQTVLSRCVLLREDIAANYDEDPELLEIWNQKYFFQYRNMIKEKLKNRDRVLKFLDALERHARDNYNVELVLRVEETRKDIMSQMGTKQALKRLYLQMKK